MCQYRVEQHALRVCAQISAQQMRLGGGACRGVRARTYERELHCQEVSLVVAERTQMAVLCKTERKVAEILPV
jgi:hypothetical protein